MGRGGSDTDTGHLGYDQHNIQTIEYRDGEFVQIAERTIPHLLWSDAWKEYYGIPR